MNFLKHIILICFISALSQANAQQYYFKQFTTEDGLVSSQVRVIHQDNFGYLWVGTATGLSRFDGKKFENFTSSEFLVDPQVNAIFNRQKGGVWVVSSKGITSFDNKKIITKDLTEFIGDDNIYDASEDSKGNIWCLVYKKGLLKIPADTNEDISLHTALESYTSLFIDEKDLAYLSGGTGHIKKINLNNDKREEIKTLHQAEVSRQTTLYSGDTLIATDAVHAFFIVNGVVRDFFFENNIGGSRDVFVDSRKNIWITAKSGLRKISSNGNRIRFNVENGMPFESIRTVYEDQDKNIWIGTEGGGLLKFFPKQEFVSYTKKDGLPSEQIMSILEDDNKMWFSTFSDGVFSTENGIHTQFTNHEGLPNNTVWSSAKGKDGKLWFATSKGLACFKDNRFVNYLKSDGLPSSRVTALFFDKDEQLWIGSKLGVSIFKNDSIVSFGKKEGFEGYRVRSIKQDSEGVVWIGCKNGLFKIQDEQSSAVVEVNNLSLNAQIYSIDMTKNHVLIGASSGLYFYNKRTKELKKATFLNEHIDHSAYFLIQEKGTLWLGSGDGLWRYEIKEEGNEIEISSRFHYGKKNGISNLETNQNSAYIDRDGLLWFGTGQGLVSRTGEPLQDISNEQTLKIQITNIRLFLGPLPNVTNTHSLPNDLELKHNQNHLTFDYESIYLENPEQIKYQFKLEGFDVDWLPATPVSTFSYTNLSHGKYKFEVRSSLDGENWNEPVGIDFIITPPFWLKSWFLTLCSILFFVIIYIVYRWRTKINERKRESERLGYKNKLLALEQQSLSSSMNRHFIFNALNSIQYYINTQDRLSANKYLSSFAKLIRKNLESSGSKDNLIPLKEELERIELYLELENMRFQDKISYIIKVQSGLNVEEIMLPPMFFQPFIENSIWHGILPKNGGKVEIDISKITKDTVRISIEDDGVGIKTSQANKNTTSHNSKGVYLTKRRIELLEKTINKKIEVIGPEEVFDHNNLVVGTRVEIILPVDKET